MPTNFLEWIAYLGLAIPLFVLAWSAWKYVSELKIQREREEYHRIFEVMDHLGQQGGSIASKMAAAYELRKFKNYSEVIIRLCNTVEIDGVSAKMLKDELELTKKYLSK